MYDFLAWVEYGSADLICVKVFTLSTLINICIMYPMKHHDDASIYSFFLKVTVISLECYLYVYICVRLSIGATKCRSPCSVNLPIRLELYTFICSLVPDAIIRWIVCIRGANICNTMPTNHKNSYNVDIWLCNLNSNPVANNLNWYATELSCFIIWNVCT